MLVLGSGGRIIGVNIRAWRFLTTLLGRFSFENRTRANRRGYPPGFVRESYVMCAGLTALPRKKPEDCRTTTGSGISGGTTTSGASVVPPRIDPVHVRSVVRPFP